MKKWFFLIAVIMILLIGLSLTAVPAADEEALGRQAEEAGELRQALTHYVSALQSVSEGSSDDQRLREKIVRLVKKIEPPPAIPEEAKRRMARGRAAVDAARNEEGFRRAAEEFKAAVRVAPWLADGYYNLGIVQDKAALHTEAIRSLKLYLLAAPGAVDAEKVQNLIYEIEYRQEEVQRVQREKLVAVKKTNDLNGYWEYRVPSSGYWIRYQITVSGNNFYAECVSGESQYTCQAVNIPTRITGVISGDTVQGNWEMNTSMWEVYLRRCGYEVRSLPFKARVINEKEIEVTYRYKIDPRSIYNPCMEQDITQRWTRQ